MKRTARQLCYEVAAYKSKREAEAGMILSVVEIQAEYAKGASGATAKSCAISEGFVNDALLVYKLLENPDVSQVVDELEHRFGLESCLNSLVKLRIVSGRCEDVQSQRWVCEGLLDAVLRGQASNDSISKQALLGTANVPSLVDNLKFRRVALDYFMDVEMPKLGLDLEDVSKMREHLKTHRDYRETVNGVGDAPANSSWMASLKESSILGLRLLEAQCHKSVCFQTWGGQLLSNLFFLLRAFCLVFVSRTHRPWVLALR